MAEKTPDDIDAVIERECREWMASPTHEPMDYRVPGLLRQLDRLTAQLKEARTALKWSRGPTGVQDMKDGTSVHLEHKDILDRAKTVAEHLRIMWDCRPIKLYGVPRGGVPAAYAVLSCLQGEAQVVEDPAQAHAIIDDFIDSGATRDRYRKKYPDKSFSALYVHEPLWLVFPWEASEESFATASTSCAQKCSTGKVGK